jgi:DNA-binding XRE family transcriptional regulator
MMQPIGEIERAFNKEVGRRIEADRIKARFSQQQMAVEIGVHRNAIMRWEKGTHAVPLWQLLRIADILDCHHLRLLPAKEFTWGTELREIMHERDPKRRIRYERDPALTTVERCL